jgi:hypothetical protein
VLIRDEHKKFHVLSSTGYSVCRNIRPVEKDKYLENYLEFVSDQKLKLAELFCKTCFDTLMALAMARYNYFKDRI